jgi:hypothetical protein
MFGKKKIVLPPYALRVLTTEYLIEGTIPGGNYLAINAPLHLSDARIQSTQSAGVPPQAAPNFVIQGTTTVALVPNVDHTQLEQYILWKEYRNSIAGVFFVGPYVMRGRMMAQSMSIFPEESPVYDVQISCPVSGNAWAGIYAPFALVNARWMHGYIPG